MTGPDQSNGPQEGGGTSAERILGHVRARLNAMRDRIGSGGLRLSGNVDIADLIVPVLAVGTVTLLTGATLLASPFSLAHICLILGVGLTGAAAVGALMTGIERRPVSQDLARFRVLGERLEHGIERLKDLQWELRDNEARYRDLLDTQNDVITRVDAHGRLTFVNRAFCRNFGVEAGAVLGTAFKLEVLQSEPAATDAPAEPGRRVRFEQLISTQSGARWFAFEQHAVSSDDGQVTEQQLIGRDITEQRRIQEALAEARDQAEAANRAKSRFLAAMSHEIRTPMNGILGMTSLLFETGMSAEQKSYAFAIDHSAKNLLTIIDEILDLSKIEAGKLEIHTAPFPIHACVQSVVELLAPKAREKSLDLAWRIAPELPRMLIGDETRVRQILLNLVGNAIKFTTSGGVAVRIRSVEPGDTVSAPALQHFLEVVVTDTGPGIAPDQISLLFAEFEQADADRRKHGGTGLGLAISRRLARAMGGDITVESRVGAGCTFKARLALGHAEGFKPILSPVRIPNTRRILLVSDRSIERQIMAESLAALHVSNRATSVNSAKSMILRAGREGRPFDAIVADGDMGHDGLGEVLAEARRIARRPVRGIVVIDQPNSPRLALYRAAGCDAYLVRPVRPVSLAGQLGIASGLEPANQVDATTAKSVPRDPVAGVRQRRILLVEDNDINALLARRMSERAGCSVVHAASGAAALAHCETVIADPDASVDLVLMDIHMPEMDGFEASRRIKRCFASHGRVAPPIVALTANAFAEDRKRCLEGGLDDYLAKPFDRSELEALLDKWCLANVTRREGALGEDAA